MPELAPKLMKGVAVIRLTISPYSANVGVFYRAGVGVVNQPALSTTVNPINSAVNVQVTRLRVISALLVLVNNWA